MKQSSNIESDPWKKSYAAGREFGLGTPREEETVSPEREEDRRASGSWSKSIENSDCGINSGAGTNFAEQVARMTRHILRNFLGIYEVLRNDNGPYRLRDPASWPPLKGLLEGQR